jgi:plasmid stabilization system protein ParE
VSLTVVVRPEAEGDLKEAREWYEAQEAGTGDELIAEVEGALLRIAAGPTRYPVLFRKVRRCLVRRFPISIYFVVRGNSVIVLAILHQRRDPKLWRRRAGS